MSMTRLISSQLSMKGFSACSVVRFTAANTWSTMLRNVSLFLYARMRPATRAAIATTMMPIGFAVRAMFSAYCAIVQATVEALAMALTAWNAVMAAFTPTTVAASAPMTAPSLTMTSVLSLTNPATWTRIGASCLSTGRRAMPISSWVSCNVSWKILYWPAAVSAASAAAPPVRRASSALIFAKSPDSIAALLMPGMSLARALPLPAYAFERALLIASVLLPVAALTSRAMARPCWALVTSPVAVASFARAGRSSSSATPVDRLSWLM